MKNRNLHLDKGRTFEANYDFFFSQPKGILNKFILELDIRKFMYDAVKTNFIKNLREKISKEMLLWKFICIL